MRAEREKNYQLEEDVTSFLHLLKLQSKEGKEELSGFLQPVLKINQRAVWIDMLDRTMDVFFRNNELDFLSIQKEELTFRLAAVSSFRNECIEWNGRIVEAQKRIGEAREKLRESVHRLRELVDIAEGKHRIQFAVSVRTFRNASDSDKQKIARDVFDQIATYNLSSFKSEIDTLSLLTERLFNERAIDLFIDFKDNQIKPVLSRIQRIVAFLNDSYDHAFTEEEKGIQTIVYNLFGENTVFNDSYQTIQLGNGGVYILLADYLAMLSAREDYQKQLISHFQAFDEIQQRLQNALFDRISKASFIAGQRIRESSYIIYGITVFLFILFLILAKIILKAVNHQVEFIKSTNNILQSQANELEGVNLTLSSEIEKRKESEQAVQVSEERYRSLFETSREGIVFVDLDGCIEHANHAYLNILGYTLEEVKNKLISDFTPARWNEYERNIQSNQVMERGYSDEYEKEIIRKDGTLRAVTVRTWLVMNEEKQPVRMLRLLRDITVQKVLEDELQQKSLDYERQQAMLTSFATVCHYLSQPLTALWGTLGILKRKPGIMDNADIYKHLQNCIQSTNTMAELIEKLQAIEEFKTTDYSKFTEMIDMERE